MHTDQLHGGSKGFDQGNAIQRETAAPGSAGCQSERKDPSGYGFQNPNTLGHYAQALPRLSTTQPRIGSELFTNGTL